MSSMRRASRSEASLAEAWLWPFSRRAESVLSPWMKGGMVIS